MQIFTSDTRQAINNHLEEPKCVRKFSNDDVRERLEDYISSVRLADKKSEFGQAFFRDALLSIPDDVSLEGFERVLDCTEPDLCGRIEVVELWIEIMTAIDGYVLWQMSHPPLFEPEQLWESTTAAAARLRASFSSQLKLEY